MVLSTERSGSVTCAPSIPGIKQGVDEGGGGGGGVILSPVRMRQCPLFDTYQGMHHTKPFYHVSTCNICYMVEAGSTMLDLVCIPGL